ncbi:MAG: histone deacetylase [Candidatus Omnitrophica bacterium]|nr:histone deacetylase [Candidatus Omnitrophota bacterium]
MHPENKKRLETWAQSPCAEIPYDESLPGLIHTESYIRSVRDLCLAGGGHLDADTVVSGRSYESAVLAAAATVLASRTQNFALVRPPGHHAHPDKASGFCIFNNIAIAVQKLVNENKRVLIFDFDGHLGDGTEKIFYESDQVLYWSLHQSPAFPYWGDEHQIGEGAGKGYTLNMPLPPATGDDLFWKAIEALTPIAKQFAPDVVAVSAGFDAHQFDLLLDLRLSAGIFYKLGQWLRKNFDCFFATLEGGYNVELFPHCVDNFLCGVNNLPMAYKEQPTDSSMQVTEEFDFRLHALIDHLKPYWSLS